MNALSILGNPGRTLAPKDHLLRAGLSVNSRDRVVLPKASIGVLALRHSYSDIW